MRASHMCLLTPITTNPSILGNIAVFASCTQIVVLNLIGCKKLEGRLAGGVGGCLIGVASRQHLRNFLGTVLMVVLIPHITCKPAHPRRHCRVRIMHTNPGAQPVVHEAHRYVGMVVGAALGVASRQHQHAHFHTQTCALPLISQHIPTPNRRDSGAGWAGKPDEPQPRGVRQARR